MNNKAIIFDLDGTLLDSLEDLAVAANRVLERFDYPTHPIERYCYFIGEGARIAMQRASGIEEETLLTKLTKEFTAEYAKSVDTYSRLYEGIESLLDSLEALPLKKAILSNKPHHLTLRCHKSFLDKWTFDYVFGLREGTPKKPDPFSANELARLFNIAPENIVYVGDTKTDMLTATAAGMYAVGVTWGFRENRELLDHGAELLVEHPHEIIKLFQSSV